MYHLRILHFKATVMFRKVIYIEPVTWEDRFMPGIQKYDSQITRTHYYIFGVKVWISVIETKRGVKAFYQEHH